MLTKTRGTAIIPFVVAPGLSCLDASRVVRFVKGAQLDASSPVSSLSNSSDFVPVAFRAVVYIYKTVFHRRSFDKFNLDQGSDDKYRDTNVIRVKNVEIIESRHKVA